MPMLLLHAVVALFLLCSLQGLCSVYEKCEAEASMSKSELIQAYQKLMTLFPRLGLYRCVCDAPYQPALVKVCHSESREVNMS